MLWSARAALVMTDGARRDEIRRKGKGGERQTERENRRDIKGGRVRERQGQS